jgi:hypothetical protein
MLILLSILLLFLASLVMLAIRLAWPDFVYHWLIAVGGAFTVWVLVLVAGGKMPQVIPPGTTVPLTSSQPSALFLGWPTFLVDRFSWPFAVALASLVLAIILTDVARAAEADWDTWAGCLSLTGLGLAAILAGNPLTLLLSWMAIDLGELLILLGQVKQSAARERMVVAFSSRLVGSMLLITAGLVTQAKTGKELTFTEIPPMAAWLLLLSAGFRLGVLPLQMPFLQDLPLRRGLGTISRLTPAAASFVLLTRTATTTQVTPLFPYLLVLTGLAAIYGGVIWVMAANELDGRPAWILGLAALAVGAALRGQASASLAWGLAAILTGGMIFLTSVRGHRLQWFTLLGLWSISALPFSPAWNGAFLFTPPFLVSLILFWLAQVLFLVGYFRHTLRPAPPLAGVERWVWLIYPLGLILLFSMQVFLGLRATPTLAGLPSAMWWVSIVPVTIFLVALVAIRSDRFPFRSMGLLRSMLSFNWLYRLLCVIYHSVGRLIKFLTEVLEGEGGVLWALLILVISLLVFSRTAVNLP